MQENSNRELVQRVAAKAVIKCEEGVLALHPSSIDPNKKWHVPGGIRDDINEPLMDTAIREVKEETGIDLSGVSGKVIKVGEWRAVDKGEQVKILGVFYYFELDSKPAVTLSNEHDRFAWLNSANFRNYETNEDLKESIELVYSI